MLSHAAAGGVIAANAGVLLFTLAHFISTSPPDNSISCSRVVNYYRSALQISIVSPASADECGAP
jgi:hypothetical protein